MIQAGLSLPWHDFLTGRTNHRWSTQGRRCPRARINDNPMLSKTKGICLQGRIPSRPRLDRPPVGSLGALPQFCTEVFALSVGKNQFSRIAGHPANTSTRDAKSFLHNA